MFRRRKPFVVALLALAAVFVAGVCEAATKWYGTSIDAATAWRDAKMSACRGYPATGSWFYSSTVVDGGKSWMVWYSSTYGSGSCETPIEYLEAYLPNGWACPNGQVVNATDGSCVLPPDEACAAKAGQPGPILRGNFDGFENDSYSDADGCEVVPVGEVTCVIPYSEQNAQRDYEPPVCSIPSEYTGTYSETGAQSPTQLTALPPPQATTDSRETTESSVTDPATVTTNPDGSQTTTQTTTKTKVSEAGSTVSAPSPSKSVVVSQEGGKVIVVVTEVTSTTHPDGRVVTTTTVTKSVTSTPKTTTTVNAPAGQKPTVTVDTTPEATDSGKTKTTVTAYPDGTTETSTETTGGGGQGADGVSETPGEGEGDEPLPDGGAAAGNVGFPTLDEAPGFGESLTALSQGVAASPIAQAASSLSGLSDGSGSCNAPSFAVFGQTFALDFHCQVWPQIAPVIEAAALAAWAILAVLILMSA